MNLTLKINNVLRGLKQRWAASSTKRNLWDKEYAGGRWNHCDQTPDALVYRYVEKYCANGSVLDLGCGSGNTGNELDVSKYEHYTGVDISEVAVQKAAARSSLNGRMQKNEYVQGDIVSYVPLRKFDVILFRESIYYVPSHKIKSVLDRYSQFLADDGVLLVNASKNGSKKRAMKILKMIECNYTILARHLSAAADDFIIAFRHKVSQS